MTWVRVFDTAHVRGSVYEAGEHEMPADHATIIVTQGLGEVFEVVNEETNEQPSSTNEGNGAADRDETDAVVMAAEAGEPAETTEAPAEADEAAEAAEDAPEEAPAVEDGAAPA